MSPFVVGAILVGLGLVAGLLIGRARWRVPGTFHTRTRGNWAPLRRVSNEPDPDIARYLELYQRVAGLERSALREVLGVGLRASVGAVTIELLALEIRELGVLASFRLRDVAGSLTGPTAPVLPSPVVEVADDTGTAYLVLPASFSGTQDSAEASARFVPVPPPDARSLTITVTRLGDPPLFAPRGMPPSRRIEGPWLFVVRLPTPADQRAVEDDQA